MRQENIILIINDAVHTLCKSDKNIKTWTVSLISSQLNENQ